MQVLHYLDVSGKDVFQRWLDRLSDVRARVAILRRVDRMIAGNFGDCEWCRDGVWEVRVDVGQGYRVYHARAGKDVVLLLCGGDKRSQDRDISRAVEFWKDYKQRVGVSE